MSTPAEKIGLVLCVLAVAACERSSGRAGAAGSVDGGAGQRPAARAPAAGAAVNVDDPAACSLCHSAIVAEWQSSQHAIAHDDPIVKAVLALRITREGEGLWEKCTRCHAPRMADRGVTCAACHARNWPPGSKGVLMSGPHDLPPGASPAHGTGAAAAEIADGTGVCMVCHEKLANPAGVPSCTTGVEWQGVAGAGSCSSCHMPEAEGPGSLGGQRATHRAHTFVGAHARHGEQTTPLAPVELTVSVDDERGVAVVSLKNLAPHGYPTGFPGRVAAVELVFLDGSGAELSRQLLEPALTKVYVDEQGQPTLPPWSVALGKDTRLAAGETRTFEAKLPAKARRVQARLVSRLMPPLLAEKIGMKDDPLAGARLVATAEASR